MLMMYLTYICSNLWNWSHHSDPKCMWICGRSRNWISFRRNLKKMF